MLLQRSSHFSPISTHFKDNLLDIKTTIKKGKAIDQVTNSRAIVGVGDVHGDVIGLVDLLTRSKVLIDTEEKLSIRDLTTVAPTQRYVLNPHIPKGTQIVFTGDLLDRGDQSIQVIDLLRSLSKQAESLDISLHFIKGNHETGFLRFFELFKRRSQDEVLRAFNLRNTYDFSKELKEFEEFLKFFDPYLDLKNMNLLDMGFNPYSGIQYTINSIIQKYRSWQRAAIIMEEDGTIEFLKAMRGAIIIDGNYFTHAGPVLHKRTLDDLDDHFAEFFQNIHCFWNWSPKFSEPAKAIADYVQKGLSSNYANLLFPKSLGNEGKGNDYSASYLRKWINLPDLIQWMADLQITHMYVGHEKHSKINFYAQATNLDATLSEAYGFPYGEILIIDPLANPYVRVISGRERIPKTTVPIPARETSERDFSHGRTLLEVLNNEYTRRISELF